MSKERKKLSTRWKDILLMGILGLVLFYTSWKIFQEEDAEEAAELVLSETEVKAMRILQELDGVGEASVVVYEGREGVESVVVLCEGANDLRVVMDIREALAAALNTEQKAVKIYLKKE